CAATGGVSRRLDGIVVALEGSVDFGSAQDSQVQHHLRARRFRARPCGWVADDQGWADDARSDAYRSSAVYTLYDRYLGGRSLRTQGRAADHRMDRKFRDATAIFVCARSAEKCSRLHKPQ